MTNWKSKLGAYTHKAMPVVKVIERVASMAVHIKTPSVLSSVGLASAAVAALNETINKTSPIKAVVGVMSFANADTLTAELSKIPYIRVTPNPTHGGIYFNLHDGAFRVEESEVYFLHDVPELFQLVKQISNNILPNVIALSAGKKGIKATAHKLSNLCSEEGDNVVLNTLPFLNANQKRVVLLNGAPGVGKTTIAHQLAKASGLGRVAIVAAPLLNPVAPNYSCLTSRDFDMASIDVVIIDDIDKTPLPQGTLEWLRETCKLVILTANNGQHDQVLDGALTRPQRIDEVFEISGRAWPREAPFDLLTEEQWQRVKAWPSAWLTELKNRLLLRPHNLRLDDLEERLRKRTVSNGVLF